MIDNILILLTGVCVGFTISMILNEYLLLKPMRKQIKLLEEDFQMSVDLSVDLLKKITETYATKTDTRSKKVNILCSCEQALGKDTKVQTSRTRRVA